MIESELVLDVVSAKNVSHLGGEKFGQWFNFVGVTAAFVEIGRAFFPLPALSIRTVRSNSGDAEASVVEETTPSKAALETDLSNSLRYRETSFPDKGLSGSFTQNVSLRESA